MNFAKIAVNRCPYSYFRIAFSGVKHIWLLLLLLALYAFDAGSIRPAMAAATEYAGSTEQQRAYLDAQNDVLSFMNWYTSSSSANRYGLPTTQTAQNRIVYNLKTITGPGDGNIRKNINSAGKILVSNVSNFSGYNVTKYNNTSTDELNPSANSGVWVALAPELSTLLRNTFPSGKDPGSNALWLRTIQSLGLSPNDSYSRVSEFFIDPTQTGGQLFRPAMNTAIDQQVTATDVAYTSPWTAPTEAQKWILTHPAEYIAEPLDGPWPPNPWTGLGYTYDWNPDHPTHQGLTEFIAPGANRSATVSGVTSIGSYLYAERDSNGVYTDELNGNFKIWGTADTVWGKKNYFRKLYYTESSGVIDVTPSGHIENGVLIEDASYSLRNAGVITALKGRLAADSNKDGGKTDNVFFINHSSDLYASALTELTFRVENSGAIGHDGLGAAYTFEISTANTIKTRLNISNTGTLYAGVNGLILTGPTGGDSTVTIENHGLLYSGTNSSANAPEGGSDITLNMLRGSAYVSRGALAINGDVNFAAGSVFFVDLALNNNPVLTVGKSATIDKDAVIKGQISGGLNNAAPQSLQLISAATLSNSATNANILQGVTLLHTYKLSPSNGLLSALYEHSEAAQQTKSFSEGFLGGMALVNQGADVIAGKGMDSAVKSAHEGQAIGSGWNTFGMLSGGWSRYDTGSQVDLSSISLMTGLACGAELKPGKLTLGLFFEYGNGSYNTHNSFSNAASVKGDGDTNYVGGGILGRLDFIDTGHGHFYAEGSGRTGRVHNDYASGDLRDFTGSKAEYEDSSSAYYGLHAGAGYVWNLNEKSTLDFYAKYFWTHQEGDSERLSTGDPLSFAPINSSRARAGARIDYAINEHFSPYIGAAIEREFDGEARASTNGYSIDAPSLKGNTGIGELGLSYKPSATLPLTFDLGAQGYAGKREGVTGSLQVKYEF
jgi:hypothetical protein